MAADFIRPGSENPIHAFVRVLRFISPFRLAMAGCSVFFFWGAVNSESTFYLAMTVLPVIFFLFIMDVVLRKLLAHPKDGVMIWFIELLTLAGGALLLLSVEV